MILAVARTHLARLRRDRAAFVLSFVVPVVFFSVFAAIFGGPSRSATRQIPVAVVDEDRSGNSRRFLEALRAEAGLSVRAADEAPGQEPAAPRDRAGAERIVRAGEVSVALIVPKGFGEGSIAFGSAPDRKKLLILADTSDPVAPQILTGLLQKVAMTSMPDVVAEAGIAQLNRWAGPLTEKQRANLEESVRRLRESAASGAASGPTGSTGLVAVEVRDVLGETKKNPTSALLAAGLGVMFLLFSASGAGGALIEEAESGTLDRILATRVTMTELLLGKLLYLSSVAVAQLAVMFVWGEVFFGVELHRHIAGFLIMAAVTAVAASSFGLVLAALSRTRIQLVAIANLSILVMSALGGSMVPRYFLSEKIQKLGLVTLNAWAIDGFMKVFWREEPVSHLAPQVAVLLAASLALFAGARRLARRWEAD